jgi:hypothetical protein
MKKFHIRLVGLLISLMVILLIFTISARSFASAPQVEEKIGAAAFFFQATPTPQVQDKSEVGSTDGIVLMGVVIVMIIVVPILLRRKTWADS